MKALTNILNYMLLMLLLLIPAACTEETAEVDNLSRGEQYVTVRMNIPGMTAAATRAADGVIETIHALAFNEDKELLGIRTATNLTQSSFNLVVPNGTETIHFLANNTVSLPEVGADVSVLTSLTTGDYNNLCYWGMATTSDGNTNDLNVTLYRNLAKISIKPSVGEDAVFNDFTQEELIISGLMNPNRVGKLVPYNNDSFYSNQSGTAPDYLTLPDNPDRLDKTPIGNDGAGYGNWLYVFEHDNPKDFNTGLFVICNIGGAYYKVALVDTNGEPYPIIRNHEYIIYVSDVDDYAYDTNYRAETYEEAFEKLPINLEVEVIELLDVKFSPTEQQTVQMGNTLSISMTVPTDRILTNFSIEAEGFTFNAPNDTYEAGTTTFTFTPNNVGDYTITFTGSGENLNPVNTTINVKVTEMPKVTFEYQDNQTIQVGNSITVTMNVPEGGTLNTLNISADGFTIKQGDSEIGTGSYNGTSLNYSKTQITYTFVATSAVSKTITFNGSGYNLNVPQTTINVTVVEQMPEAGDEVVIWDSTKDSEITTLPQGYILLTVGRTGSGSADSFDSYFKAGATLYIEFKCNINESWQQPNLTLRTSWSTTFTTLTYTEGDMECSDVHQMSYTFKEDDISGNVNAGNITNAGLQLNGNYLDITKIYIIPASTP